MLIIAYLVITFYQWDILWILDLSTYSPANRVAAFILGLLFGLPIVTGKQLLPNKLLLTFI